MTLIIKNKEQLVKFYEKFYRKEELNEQEMKYIDAEVELMEKRKCGIIAKFDDETDEFISAKPLKIALD